jgi:hypothetical protein
MTKTEWNIDIWHLEEVIHKTAEQIVDTLIEHDVPMNTGLAALAWVISAAVRTMPPEIAREKVTLIKTLLDHSLWMTIRG